MRKLGLTFVILIMLLLSRFDSEFIEIVELIVRNGFGEINFFYDRLFTDYTVKFHKCKAHGRFSVKRKKWIAKVPGNSKILRKPNKHQKKLQVSKILNFEFLFKFLYSFLKVFLSFVKKKHKNRPWYGVNCVKHCNFF